MRDSVDFANVGIAIGHATDVAGATGLTVIRGIHGPLRAGVAIVGRATGSRELHAASADHLVAGRVDAILLTGGSAYGLDAAAGVMRWMEEHGRGYPVGVGVVPIVPAAVVFDLSPLGRADARPTPQMAYDATEHATSNEVAEGSVGAGAGATIGKVLGSVNAMKGGFGCAIEHAPSSGGDTLSVAAMVVVNAMGDVRDARGAIIAGARTQTGFADAMSVLQHGGRRSTRDVEDLALQNTTLAVVAVSGALAASKLTQLARAASAALFRRITPCGSSLDGDIVFAVSPVEGEHASVEPMIVEALAVSALERAIERAVRMARGRDGIPGLADKSDDVGNNGDHGD
jgi:L-aminopeptidase/D-esterase-like protein